MPRGFNERIRKRVKDDAIAEDDKLIRAPRNSLSVAQAKSSGGLVLRQVPTGAGRPRDASAGDDGIQALGLRGLLPKRDRQNDARKKRMMRISRWQEAKGTRASDGASGMGKREGLASLECQRSPWACRGREKERERALVEVGRNGGKEIFCGLTGDKQPAGQPNGGSEGAELSLSRGKRWAERRSAGQKRGGCHAGQIS